MSHCCVHPAASGLDNISDDPMFVNAAAGDYRLSCGSPCINAGTNQPWMVGAMDIAGERRVARIIVDIGAYEVQPPCGSVLSIK